MYKMNGTSEFLHTLGPEMRKFLRKVTRTQDASGASHNRRIQLAQFREKVAEDKTNKQNARMEKHAAAAREIDAVSPILAVTELDFRATKPKGSDGYLTVAELTKQLKWHKVHGIKEALPTAEKNWGNRGEKVELLHTVIERYIEARGFGGSTEKASEEPEEDPEVSAQDLEDFDSDGYNSEEDYYK